MATFQRLEYLLWKGVQILFYHHNLEYILDPEACKGVVAKATSQRLEHRRTFLTTSSPLCISRELIMTGVNVYHVCGRSRRYRCR